LTAAALSRSFFFMLRWILFLGLIGLPVFGQQGRISLAFEYPGWRCSWGDHHRGPDPPEQGAGDQSVNVRVAEASG
jgi:hypothetical protein